MALNWETAEPCIVENSDTGQLFYGDTDTPIRHIWDADTASAYIREYIDFAGEDEIEKLLKHIGYKVIRRHEEFIILEDKNE